MLIFLFVLGLAVLSIGAEMFVRGASRLAALVGISPLVVGLTVVAFGTSAPELAVVVRAGLDGQGELAFGNIVGSNISNFLFILGVAALISPLVVSRRLIQLEVPLLLALTTGVIFMGLDGIISTLEGGVLFVGVALYTIFVIRHSKNAPEDWPQPGQPSGQEGRVDAAANEEPTDRRKVWVKHGLFLLGGLVGLVAGANWLVEGASGIARSFGVSELVIGLTMVALGTSLPELATSVAATLRGERDLAIGNIIGSNLFNLMFVLGVAAVIVPQGLPVPSSSVSFDMPVMLAVIAASMPIFFSGYKISRWEGLLFLAYYGAYVLYLLLFSVEHDMLPRYSTLMLRYIIPPTALLLLFVLGKSLLTREKNV